MPTETRSTRSLQTVIARAAAAVSVPRSTSADSFVLHAPLELIARVGLLPLVRAGQRDGALERIEGLMADFEAAGDPVDHPAPLDFDDLESAAAWLVGALAAGDLDDVDAGVSWLGAHASHYELRGLLGEYLVPSLAAAGHAPIALSLLPVVLDGMLPGTLLRGPLREIARRPEWRLTWFDSTHGLDHPQSLFDALAAVPRLGSPGSDFIYPLMSQVERSGVAADLLGPVLGPVLGDRFDVASARHTIGRVAAWSMLHDDPTHAPYGWTHCLTMPYAVMDLAGTGVPARTALAVAATYVAGFRAAHSQVALQRPVGPTGAPLPDPADLATSASLHDDAHLVKYTMTCLQAAADDVEMRALYLHAAQYLADWWRGRPE